MNLGPEQRAHHEAGHAVAVHCLGRKLEYVLLDMDDAKNSVCKTLGEWIGHQQIEEGLRAWMCFDLAGQAADRWHLRDQLPPRASLRGWRQDAIDARSLAEMVAKNRGIEVGDPTFAGTVDQIIAIEQLRADDFVRSNWAGVAAVAAELLDRGRVPGGDVHKIIRRAAVSDGWD